MTKTKLANYFEVAQIGGQEIKSSQKKVLFVTLINNNNNRYKVYNLVIRVYVRLCKVILEKVLLEIEHLDLVKFNI